MGRVCFFLESVERIRTNYAALFQGGDENDGGGGSGTFNEQFAWFTIIEQIAIVHRITFSDAMSMRGDEFINTWAYIDGKIKRQKALMAT